MDVEVKIVTEDPGTGTADPGTGAAESEDPMDMDEPVPLCMIRPPPRWAQGIMTYLESGELPEDEVLSRQIQRRSKAYVIWQGELPRKSPTAILERCVEPEEGERILHDIHGGDCGHHASSRYLVGKAFRYGFYWPTALQQAEELVRRDRKSVV